MEGTKKAVVVPEALKNLAFALPGQLPPKRATTTKPKNDDDLVDDSPRSQPPSSREEPQPAAPQSDIVVRAGGARGRKRPARIAKAAEIAERTVLDDDDDIDLDASQPVLLRPNSYRSSKPVVLRSSVVIERAEHLESISEEEQSRKSSWWANEPQQQEPANDNNNNSEAKDNQTTSSPNASQSQQSQTQTSPQDRQQQQQPAETEGTLRAKLELARNRLVAEREGRIELTNKVAELRSIVDAVVIDRRLQSQVKAALKPVYVESELEKQFRHMQRAILWEGRMEKEGGLFKSWRERWLVLRGTSLYYYEDEAKTTLRGELKLDGRVCDVVRRTHLESMREIIDLKLDNNKSALFSASDQVMQACVSAMLCKRACLVYLRQCLEFDQEPLAAVLDLVNHPEYKAFAFNPNNDPTVVIKEPECRCILPTLARTSQLTHLSLANTGLSDKITTLLAPAFEDNCYLMHLDLGNNALTAAGLMSVAAAFQNDRRHNLESIALDDNPLGDAGVAIVSKMLSASIPRLSSVSLHRVGLSDTGVESLVLGLSQLASFREGQVKFVLGLAGNQLTSASAERIASLIVPLRIGELDLQDNLIEDQGAEALAGVIAGCTTLTKLNLRSNPMTETGGVKAIAKAVITNRSINEALLPANHTLSLTTLATVRLCWDTMALNGQAIKKDK